MSLDAVIVICTIIIMLICLMKEVARPDFIVFCALAFLMFTGILAPADALVGFSNEGMLTVGLLFIVAGAVQQSGILNQLVYRALGKKEGSSAMIPRMMLPVSGLSAFLNNTPIVVMFTPVIKDWCKKHNVAPSKFLIPLSYAAIFGGTLTLIGTSTNLIIHGLMLDQDMAGFSMFQLTAVSLPACIIGIIYLSTIGYKLLPVRKSSEESFTEHAKEYLAQSRITKASPLIGKTIEEAGLRNLKGLYLIEVISGTERIAPVPSYYQLKERDRLIFTGLLSTIVELHQVKGLRVETGTDIELDELSNGRAVLNEVVIPSQSPLAYSTLKENQFRSRFQAGVVAVHRAQARIQNKVGDIVLKPGDTLLLLSDREFAEKHKESKLFYFMNTTAQQELVPQKKSFIALFTLIGMILLASTNVLSMFMSAMLAVIVLILTRTITLEGAKNYVHFNVLILIACSIGIGAALQQTGAAEFIATYLVSWTAGVGIIGTIAAVYILTNIFTEVITNNAAAVLMFPIAFASAGQVGIDPMGLFVTIAIAASASFITPIGYQTNLIVYGPGGYKFTDYIKVGLPLTIMYMVVTVTMVHLLWV